MRTGDSPRLDANNYSGAEGDASARRWYGSTSDTGGNRLYSRISSPLINYLGGNTRVFDCPGFQFVPSEPGPERGSGGYGYNDYIGTSAPCPMTKTQANRQVGCSPIGQTRFSTRVMFADVATVVDASGVIAANTSGDGRIAEYYSIVAPKTCMGGNNGRPSLHFRHSLRANVAWCDGHVSSQSLEFSRNGFSVYQLGWFGPDSNEYFGKMGDRSM